MYHFLSHPVMSSSKECFILRFRDRRVLVFSNQCPHYSDILALARTTFASLQHTAVEDIVFLGGGKDCPWYGVDVELSERAWETFCPQLEYVAVALKQEIIQREQLAEKVESKLESDSE